MTTKGDSFSRSIPIPITLNDFKKSNKGFKYNKFKGFWVGGKRKNNLTIYKFFLGCFVLWVMMLSAIFVYGQKPTSAYARYDSDLNTHILPDIKFSNIGIKPQVLGVVENQKPEAIKPENPYSEYEFTGQLYEVNPELVKTLEKKIGEYIDTYRSYEGADQRFDVPVQSVVFLETSLKYQVPLSYTMTVARLESRFGTDCYTELSATRICKHRNIYSLGLDDSGNNWTFQKWEDGVYAFGQWYQDHVDRGFTTCQIWRKYNPNGDYCRKVMDMAIEIEKYFNQN